jgi:hypothetical protein
MKPSDARFFDASAIGLSGLCLLHCLALPVAAAFLPALAFWQASEWVHVLFVMLAVPLAGIALWRSHRVSALPKALWMLSAGGVAALAMGAIGWPSHAWETAITVAGSVLLASAHAWNWRRRHSRAKSCV